MEDVEEMTVPENIFLYGAFRRGYSKALCDLIKDWDSICHDLKCHHTTMNAKKAKEFIMCWCENREELMEVPPRGFVRWNGSKQGFEYYVPKGGTKV